MMRRVTALRRAPTAGYLFGLATFLLAFGTRSWLGDSLPAGFPYLTFFPAVIVTAFVAGLGPGSAVAVASGIAAWYFFIPPVHTFAVDGGKALALAFYALIVSVDIALIHVMTVSLDRLEVEKGRSQALAENREILFRELQHRISNNLQIVSALMLLQKGSVADEGARRVIDEAAGRLALIGKIHRRLHDPAGQQLGFDGFLKDLCHDVIEASGARGIVCLVQAEPLVLPAERTIPVALIMTELVSNALEHGFAGRSRGTITVTLAPERGGWLNLTVSDDGAGLGPSFDLATTRSLGLRIVRSLTTQLGGRFEMAGGRGTVCRLHFPA